MTLAIVQARMGSTRFPGKVIQEVNGLPLVLHTVRRLTKCALIDAIIVATPWGKDNKPLWSVGAIPVGVDDDDVLGRYKAVADMVYADRIVRITGDCPLIDPEFVDKTISVLKDHDLATTVFPTRTFAKGADIEVLSRKGLDKVDRLCKDERREHVTLYMYDNPESFDIAPVYDTEDNSSIVICVDYPEDLDRVRGILEWNEDASYREIIRYLKEQDESEVSGIPNVDGGASFSN